MRHVTPVKRGTTRSQFRTTVADADREGVEGLGIEALVFDETFEYRALQVGHEVRVAIEVVDADVPQASLVIRVYHVSDFPRPIDSHGFNLNDDKNLYLRMLSHLVTSMVFDAAQP